MKPIEPSNRGFEQRSRSDATQLNRREKVRPVLTPEELELQSRQFSEWLESDNGQPTQMPFVTGSHHFGLLETGPIGQETKPEQADDRSEIRDLVSSLVREITLSRGAGSNNETVHLIFNSTQLADLEITVQRGEGRLEVVFKSNSRPVRNKLKSGRAELQRRLTVAFPGEEIMIDSLGQWI
jgi:type III secretion system needle length determinant